MTRLAKDPKRFRLVHVSDGYFTSAFFYDIARLYDRSRFEMFFASIGETTTDRREKIAAHGVPVLEFGGRQRRQYLRGLVCLSAWLRRARVDVIHTHLVEPSAIGLAAALVSSVPLRVMSRHHGDSAYLLKKRVPVLVDRANTALAHVVITQSNYQKTLMIERERADPDKVVVNHLGIDTEAFRRPAQADIARARHDLGLRSEKVILVAGRLDGLKGQGDLIQALPQVAQAVTGGVRLLVAGEGPRQGVLESQARDLGVANIVSFLGFRSDMEVLLALATVSVLPSLTEAFPQVLLEAMARGVPVVATPVGGVPEMVIEGETGFLVPVRAPDLLADRIVRLLNDDALRTRLGEAGRRWVAQQFNARNMVRRNEEVYTRLLRGRGDRHVP